MELDPRGTGPWVVPGVTSVAVLVLDVCVIVVLVGLGLTSHGVDPIGQPMRLAETALPFVIGWLVMSPILGAFSARAFSSLPRMMLHTAASWLGATILGMSIRSTELVSGGTDPIFVLVMTTTGILLLVPWRSLLLLGGLRIGVFAGSRTDR